MNYRENEITVKLIDEFKRLVFDFQIGDFNYFIEKRVRIGEERRGFIVDLIVQINNFELYFEIADSRKFSDRNNLSPLSINLSRPNRFFLYCNDSLNFRLDDPQRGEYIFDNVFSLYNFILERSRRPKPEPTLLRGIFLNVLENFISNTNSSQLIEIQRLAFSQSIVRDLKFDEKNNLYYFTDDILDEDNFENKLFNFLLEDLNVGDIFYRYGDLKLAFHTVQDVSCKFSGIPGMNDISEVGYTDHYLDNDYIPLDNPTDVANINRKFILCSSLLKDNLTQWRLYGDDCKGTSIEFEIIKKSKDFILKKISYGTEKNSENFHLELEILKLIQKEFYLVTGSELRFKTLNVWKHFFKSFEYAVEEEVRVLYIENQKSNLNIKWNLTFTHNILNPFLVFPLNKIPLKINQILLGSKCPENEVNLKQFRNYASLQSLTFDFDLSRIKNYR